MFRKLAVAGLVALGGVAHEAQAQDPSDMVRATYRSGPRFGVTWLSGALVDEVKKRYD